LLPCTDEWPRPFGGGLGLVVGVNELDALEAVSVGGELEPGVEAIRVASVAEGVVALGFFPLP
jgi:hypothetical protein